MLVADESVEGPTVCALRDAGHAVLFIAEMSPGIEDSEVLAIARREGALRSPQDDPDENAANTLAAIRQYGPELVGRFSVLAGGALRIRMTPHWPVVDDSGSDG